MGRVNLASTVKTWRKDICNEVVRTRKRTGAYNGVRDYPGAAVIAADNQLTFSGRGRSSKPQFMEYYDTPQLEKKM